MELWQILTAIGAILSCLVSVGFFLFFQEDVDLEPYVKNETIIERLVNKKINEKGNGSYTVPFDSILIFDEDSNA